MAAEQWQRIITADATDIPDDNMDWTGGSFPGYQYFGPVDDIVIVYRVVPLDGPGGLLGQAGPRYIRSATGQPISAIMEFDAGRCVTYG